MNCCRPKELHKALVLQKLVFKIIKYNKTYQIRNTKVVILLENQLPQLSKKQIQDAQRS